MQPDPRKLPLEAIELYNDFIHVIAAAQSEGSLLTSAQLGDLDA